MRTPFLLLTSIFLLSGFNSQVFAEQAILSGQYSIHYSAFPSTVISPEIAAQYNIKRSEYNALVNISPQRQSHDEEITGVKSRVQGKVTNLIGNSQKLEFQEIVEGKVVYYLAVFSFSNEEQFRFSIDVEPLDEPGQAIPIKFEKKFFRP